MAALDVLQHARAAKQFAAADRLWLLRIETFRHQKKARQSQTLAELSRAATGGRLRSGWDYCTTDEEKLRLLGCSINAHGIKWLSGRTNQLTWLRRHDYTPDDAVEAYKRWERVYKENRG